MQAAADVEKKACTGNAEKLLTHLKLRPLCVRSK